MKFEREALHSHLLDSAMGTLNNSDSIMLEGGGYFKWNVVVKCPMNHKRGNKLIVRSYNLKCPTSCGYEEAKRLKMIDDSNTIWKEVCVDIF